MAKKVKTKKTEEVVVDHLIAPTEKTLIEGDKPKKGRKRKEEQVSPKVVSVDPLTMKPEVSINAPELTTKKIVPHMLLQAIENLNNRVDLIEQILTKIITSLAVDE